MLLSMGRAHWQVAGSNEHKVSRMGGLLSLPYRYVQCVTLGKNTEYHNMSWLD